MAIQTRLYAKENRRRLFQRAEDSVDIPFLLILILLLTVGLVMLYSASSAQSAYDTGYADTTRYLQKQALCAGIGLAATQVNVHERVIVIDLSEEHDEPLVFINPELEILTEELDEMQEGCLSVPGFYETVTRPERVRVKALNRDGEAFEMICEGLLAVCIQHECDHLNGKLFVDYLSNLKRDRIRKKLEKLHRAQANA